MYENSGLGVRNRRNAHRADGKPPRWPTIGIKLSGFQRNFPATKQCSNTLEVASGCLQTMMNEWDRYSIEEATAARTIFVDSAGLSATDFHLTGDQQEKLFLTWIIHRMS